MAPSHPGPLVACNRQPAPTLIPPAPSLAQEHRMDATSALPQDTRRVDLTLARSIGLHAVRLIEWAREAGPAGLIHVAEEERRAERLAQALKGLAPDLEVLLLPPWDCLPYDSPSPSREAMGRRASVLRRMGEGSMGEGSKGEGSAA